MQSFSCVLLWIAAIIIFSVTEAAISGLVSIWFAIGSLGAFIAAVCNAGFTVQVIIFIAVSLISFCILRKSALKSIKNNREKTDIDRIVGSRVLIVEDVDNVRQTGKALINDVEWTVKSSSEESISKGETAIVEKIEGVKLFVRK